MRLSLTLVLLRSLRREIHGVRVALERVAEALERQMLSGSKGLAMWKPPGERHAPPDASSVSYLNPEAQFRLLEKVQKEQAILGRELTDDELGRVLEE